MSVKIILSDRRFSFDEKRLAALTRRVLKGELASGKSINIVYCSDRRISELNRRFRGRNRITDVLAFELMDTEEPDFLGEIYINLRQARRQAKEHKASYEKEVKRLTVHGVLHLLGFNDETKREFKLMQATQQKLLEAAWNNRA